MSGQRASMSDDSPEVGPSSPEYVANFSASRWGQSDGEDAAQQLGLLAYSRVRLINPRQDTNIMKTTVECLRRWCEKLMIIYLLKY